MLQSNEIRAIWLLLWTEWVNLLGGYGMQSEWTGVASMGIIWYHGSHSAFLDHYRFIMAKMDGK